VLTIAAPRTRSYQKAGNETKDNSLEIHLLNSPGPLRGIRSSILLPAQIKNTSSTIASMIAGMLETQTGYGCVATSPKTFTSCATISVVKPLKQQHMW
jgi:hypothetical protein